MYRFLKKSIHFLVLFTYVNSSLSFAYPPHPSDYYEVKISSSKNASGLSVLDFSIEDHCMEHNTWSGQFDFLDNRYAKEKNSINKKRLSFGQWVVEKKDRSFTFSNDDSDNPKTTTKFTLKLNDKNNIEISGLASRVKLFIENGTATVQKNQVLDIGSLDAQVGSLSIYGDLIINKKKRWETAFSLNSDVFEMGSTSFFVSLGKSWIQAISFSNNGGVFYTDQLDVRGCSQFRNINGAILQSETGMNLFVNGSLSNAGGEIKSGSGKLSAQAGEIDNRRGLIRSYGQTYIETAGRLVNSNGLIRVNQGAMIMKVKRLLDNESGRILVHPSEGKTIRYPGMLSHTTEVYGRNLYVSFGQMNNQFGQLSEFGPYLQHGEMIKGLARDVLGPPDDFWGIDNRGGVVCLYHINGKLNGHVLNSHGIFYTETGGNLTIFDFKTKQEQIGNPSQLISGGSLSCNAYDFDTSDLTLIDSLFLQSIGFKVPKGSKTVTGELTLSHKEKYESIGSATVQGSLDSKQTTLNTPFHISGGGNARLGKLDLRSESGAVHVKESGSLKAKTVEAKLSDYNDLTKCDVEELVRICLKTHEDKLYGVGSVTSKFALEQAEAGTSAPALELSGTVGGKKGTAVDSKQPVKVVASAQGKTKIGVEGSLTALQAPAVTFAAITTTAGSKVYVNSTQLPAQIEKGSVINAPDEFVTEGAGAVLAGEVNTSSFVGRGRSYDFQNNLIAQSIDCEGFTGIRVRPNVTVDGGKRTRLIGMDKDKGGSELLNQGHIAGDRTQISVSDVRGFVGAIHRRGQANNWSEYIESRPTFEGRDSLEMQFDNGLLQAAQILSGANGIKMECSTLKLVPAVLQSYVHEESRKRSSTTQRLNNVRNSFTSAGDLHIYIRDRGKLEDHGSVMKTGGDRAIKAGKDATREHLAVQDQVHQHQTKKRRGFLGVGSKTIHHNSQSSVHRGHETYAEGTVFNVGGHGVYNGANFIGKKGAHEEHYQSLIYRLGWDESSSQTQTQKGGFFINTSVSESRHDKTPVQTSYGKTRPIFTGTGSVQVDLEDKGSLEESINAEAWVLALRAQLKEQGIDPNLLSFNLQQATHEYAYDKKHSMGAGLHLMVQMAVAAVTQGFGAGVCASLGVTGSMAGTAAVSMNAALNTICTGVIGNAISERPLLSNDLMKNAAVSAVTAGATSALCNKLDVSSSPKSFSEHLEYNLVKHGVRGAANMAANGQKLEDALEAFARSVAADTVGASAANELGAGRASGEIDTVTHKVLHGLTGAVTGGIISDDPLSGALSGVVGAIVAESLAEFLGTTPENLPEKIEAERERLGDQFHYVKVYLNKKDGLGSLAKLQELFLDLLQVEMAPRLPIRHLMR